MDKILKYANSRKTVKAFKPNQHISGEQLAVVKSLLQLAPSSLNLQPWHFIIAETEQAKARMAKACSGNFAYNAPKVTQASHVVLFCVKTAIQEGYVERIIAKEAQDGRFRDQSIQDERVQLIMGSVNSHRNALKDMDCWLEKQAYLNLGALLLGVEAMGIDATPMEGFDRTTMNEEFGLNARALRASVMVALGFSDPEDDFNANLPKSRLPENEIIDVI